MKKLLTLCCFVALTTASFAQKVIRNADGSYYKQCIHFEISKPLWQLAKEHPAIKKSGEHNEARDAEHRASRKLIPDMAATFQEDPVIQKEQGAAKGTGTLANFDGAYSIVGFDPLDPTGMVGPNYFVQAVNSNYQVFNKNGTPATAPIDLATLFPGSADDGDPIVMYDKFADRWVVTEFYCPSPSNQCTTLLIAVSKTNDPTGSYYIYSFEPDVNDYADYPKYSIWSDGYYETCNCDYQKVTVYERTKMLNGDSTAGFIVIPAVSAPNNSFFCPQTLFADGQLPPFGSPQYFFYFTDDSWGGGLQDMIHIYKITTNWTTKTGTFTPYDSLVTQPFNSHFTGGTMKDISQPGTTKKLDALEGIISYRIPYLRWPTYNAALMSHSVNVSPTSTRRAGIRWYELRQDLTSQKWSIYQQGTYAPNDNVSRWNPAIAMDVNGSIGLAYSVSAPTSVYPGIRFTGRNKCDTLGKMSLSETISISGDTSWTSDSRWGDYSHTSIDPSDGLTFWHTNQYVAAGQNLNTRIFSFKIPSCPSAINNLVETQTVMNAYYSGNHTVSVSASNLPTNDALNLTVFDNEGKLIADKKVFPLDFSINTTLEINDVAAGIYYVRMSNYGFQRVAKIVIQ